MDGWMICSMHDFEKRDGMGWDGMDWRQRLLCLCMVCLFVV